LQTKEEKQKKIVEMFDSIAPTYDLANRVLSLGIDRKWRDIGCKRAYEILDKKELDQITDVACGTGDLLIYWHKNAQKLNIQVKRYIGVDPSVKMLEIAKKKVKFASFLEGKAQKLPIKDTSCDIVSISYGIRNVVDRKEALREFYRVLKSGGVVVILEFTKQQREGFFSKFIDFGMKKILPRVGGVISKNYQAYKYLPDSIEEFLTTKMLEDELRAEGFSIKYTKSFSFGISTLIVAQK